MFREEHIGHSLQDARTQPPRQNETDAEIIPPPNPKLITIELPP